MFRTLLPCCLLVLFLSISLFEDLAWSLSPPEEVIITATRLNVRDDVGGNKLGAVTRGQQFELKGTKENWGKIEFEPGRLGWISLQYTQPVAKQRSVLQERAVRPTAESESRDIPRARQALVIGNSDYAYAGMLRNPVNDAKAIGNALEQLGFEVTTVTDANQEKMERSIRDFGKQLKQNKGVGLFYFAGHGMQFGGENYLMPTDIDPSTEEDVRYDAVPLGKLLAQMRTAANGMNVVILDACRNNPFARSFRSSSKGLAQVTAPTGSFISYATAPGSVAADGDGENGLFTEKLLKHMNTPGLKLEDVFKQVRVDVQKESNNKQVPWDSSSVTGDFYFALPLTTSPEVTALDLSDLQTTRQQLQNEKLDETVWDERLQKMQQDLDRVTEFEKELVERDLKIEVWQRFLSSWADDNPYSKLDEQLRSVAEARISHLQKGGKQITLYTPDPADEEFGRQGTTFGEIWTLEQDPNFKKHAIYVGETLNDEPHGQGNLTTSNYKVVGEFRNGSPYYGTFTYNFDHSDSSDDKCSDGWFISQTSEASTGKYSGNCMVKYVGELTSDTYGVHIVGNGTSTWQDGVEYVGFHAPKGDGRGIFFSYRGYTIPGGQYGGEGTKSHPDGSRYVGEFKEGQYNGKGIKTHADGSVESGWWSDGSFLAPGSVGALRYNNSCRECDLSNQNINNERFGLNLIGADLSGSNLSKSKFSGTMLMGANLVGADLSGSLFSRFQYKYDYNAYGSSILGANLTEANLTGAILESNISAIPLTWEEAFLCKTVMPDGSVNNRDCNSSRMMLHTENVGQPEWSKYLSSRQDFGYIYFGETAAETPSGYGVMVSTDISTFSGDLNPDDKGLIKYTGEWKNGKFHGRGILGIWIWGYDDIFEGEWKNGELNGQGTYTKEDGTKYVGEFKDDKFHGQGTYTKEDGTKYVGEFKDHKFHGQGTLTLPDGEVWSGLWKDNEFLGRK